MFQLSPRNAENLSIQALLKLAEATDRPACISRSNHYVDLSPAFLRELGTHSAAEPILGVWSEGIHNGSWERMGERRRGRLEGYRYLKDNSWVRRSGVTLFLTGILTFLQTVGTLDCTFIMYSTSDVREQYPLMISGIIPRPVGFVSSISATGVHNLALFR